tara:strand:- start:1554 stop:1751 length:198 start_codon:yes stop_codon:yes gene_type:complete
MGHTDKIVSKGTSFATVLVLIFAVLKLMGLSTMSWFWVFSPWWISIIATIVIVGIGILLIFFLNK